MNLDGIETTDLRRMIKDLKRDIENAQNSLHDLTDDPWIFTPLVVRRSENKELEAFIEKETAKVKEIEAEIARRESRIIELERDFREKKAEYQKLLEEAREKIVDKLGLRDLSSDFEPIEKVYDELKHIAMESADMGTFKPLPAHRDMGSLLISVLKGE